MVNNLFILFESALGFSLFQITEAEQITIKALSKSIKNFNLFSNQCSLSAFLPYKDQDQAVDCMNKLSESILPQQLADFLQTSLPNLHSSKSSKMESEAETLNLGISDANLGNTLKEYFVSLNILNLSFVCNNITFELMRGIRQYFNKYMIGLNKDFISSNVEKSHIGLGHRFSRMKIKYNVNREDNMIIQAICILDQIDKDINTHCMRCKEWYGWHFPELTKLIPDQILYTRIVHAIGNRKNVAMIAKLRDTGMEYHVSDLPLIMDIIGGESSEIPSNVQQLMNKLNVICNDDEIMVDSILTAAKTSMGIEISSIDMRSVRVFSLRIIRLAEYRIQLYAYLQDRMGTCAPNLTALIGEQVGARLISKAGSMIKLAKYPASTLQILGAEKALFRALKSKGKCNTPKYGLIYNSTFIMKARDKNKGRISRYLANKAAMAVRLDCFLDVPTDLYGVAFRNQVDERLRFFKEGKVPSKNIDVMIKVRLQLEAENMSDEEDKEMVVDQQKKLRDKKMEKLKRKAAKKAEKKRLKAEMKAEMKAAKKLAKKRKLIGMNVADDGGSKALMEPPVKKKKIEIIEIADEEIVSASVLDAKALKKLEKKKRKAEEKRKKKAEKLKRKEEKLKRKMEAAAAAQMKKEVEVEVVDEVKVGEETPIETVEKSQKKESKKKKSKKKRKKNRSKV